jgi:CDP-diacylglycerol--glycerol-3-phosphate 3-phosphatidyltransferase
MPIHIPNTLSGLRLVISPIFFILLISSSPLNQQISVVLFIIGSFSDYLDGYYARKYNLSSNLGKFLDPLADKFLTTAAFVGFALLSIIPFWMVIIIVGRDFITTFLRMGNDEKIKTSNFAKLKTMLQMLFIAYILVLIFLRNLNYGTQMFAKYNSLIFSKLTYFTMLALVVLTLITLFDYLKPMLLKNNNNI